MAEFKRLVDRFPATLYSYNLEEVCTVLKSDSKSLLIDSEV